MKSILTFLFALLAFSGSSVPLNGQSPAPAANSAEADFPQLHRYHDANVALLGQGTPTRVVFLGDSITDYWGTRNGTWFKHAGWINRGIGGQTTAQLLLRLRDDALALHPQAIVLEGGSNDMRLGFTPQQIRDRILTMAELVQAHHIAVFVTAMTPTCDCFRPLSGLRTVPRIHELNQLLAQMCAEHKWTFVDLNSPLADAEGHMKKEITVEGVHLTDAGYALLAPIMEQALKKYR